MPTQKKFLDQTGLIQLLQQIEGLDKTNIKDLYWSTDNADVNPTVVFKVGDDNGSPHSLKKLTFKGETGTTPAGATARTLTITIGGVDKTITYYDTDNSTGISYSYVSDSADPTTATKVKEALDRVITTLVNLDPADEKVKQTAQTGNTALPILTAVSGTPTSGNNAGAGYDTDFKFTPSSNTLIVKAATASESGVTITPSSIKVGTTATNGAAELTPSQLKVGSGTLTSTAYSGKATQTETDLKTSASNKGSEMVQYDSSKTVKDALDDIYETIGGDGEGSSLTDRVEALETDKADKTAAVGSITGTTGGNETGNYTTVSGTAKTFKYNNNKVAQESDSANTNYPLLFGNASTPTTGATKYNSALKYNPSQGKITVNSSVTTSAKSVEITNTGITFATTEVGGTSVSINASNYGGTAAQATADGNGNNIVNTYATKAALEALTNQLTSSFQIVTTLPTADGTHGGIIYLIKDQEYGDVNSNIFKEYIEVNDGTTASPSWKFELLGTTDAGVDVVTIPATGTNSVASLFAQYVTNA